MNESVAFCSQLEAGREMSGEKEEEEKERKTGPE